MKFYKIKRIVVLSNNRVIFLMRNGDEISLSKDGSFCNQFGKSFNYLIDENTEEIVGFTEEITIEVEE